MIRVKIFPRIHISLINMSKDGYRRNGGAGFSISEPSLSLSVESNEDFELIDRRKYKLSEAEINRIRVKIDALQKKLKVPKSIKILIQGEALSHSGFGTGTSIRLASIESLFQLNETDYTSNKLRELSGRGGTSGIGINTYFEGGFIYDVGIKKSNRINLGPSSFYENTKNLPLKIQNLKMPSWELGICLPKSFPKISGIEEVNFFKDACPISMSQIHEINYHITFGLIPSIIESDFGAFCEAIRSLQKCEWKEKERNVYGSNLVIIEEELYERGATAVGMSSLGPCLYFLTNKMDSFFKKIKDFKYDCVFYRAKFVNHGRVINYA